MGSDLFGDWSLDDRLVDIRSGQLRISKRGEPFSLLLFTIWTGASAAGT